MKKLPLGIQTFKDIVVGDCIYFDKTQYIYSLLNDAKYYFLSRPRRFGKSLLLDTIAEVFKGDRELFKGLWIYDSGYDFIKHPVVRLDMSGIANISPDIFEKSLSNYMERCYESEGFEYESNIAADNFLNFILLLYNKYSQKVVVLIDEYDKPILDHIDDLETAAKNRQILKGFYGILKSMDPYLRFTFITGVSKFTKTSIFSGLNNLLDITMQEEYAGICGIPTGCLKEVFGEYIEQLKSNELFKQIDSITDEILAWYDGYSWDGKERLLNPHAILNFFRQKKFLWHWYSSGNPRLLIDIVKAKPELYLKLKNFKITEDMMDTFDIERIEFEPLLFQTGYLTVKNVLQKGDSTVYILDMPNYEVRDAFSMQVLSVLSCSGDVAAINAQIRIRSALESGDLRQMLDILRGLFASIPYELHVNEEAYYHSIFYAVMTMLGFDMDAEVATSGGRIDAVLELGDVVYIMEMKYVKCPKSATVEEKAKLFDSALEKAMEQIEARGYAGKYGGSGKKIYKAAFAFLGRDEIELKVAG